MAERFKAAVLKTVIPERVSRVRISPLPLCVGKLKCRQSACPCGVDGIESFSI